MRTGLLDEKERGDCEIEEGFVTTMVRVTSSEFRMFVLYKRLHGLGIMREPSA